MVEKIHSLGIVGGGQLGMMLAEAAQGLKLSTIVLDPNGENCSARKVAGAEVIKGSLRDRQLLFALARSSHSLTVEIEHLDPVALKLAALFYSRKVHPSPQVIANIQNKYLQHAILNYLGVPVAPHREIRSREEIAEELSQSPNGLVLKTKFDAYDGRGNAPINTEADIDTAVSKLQGDNPNKELYPEHRIPFDKELAMMVARGVDGTTKLYPLVETKHLRGQLGEARAPVQISDLATSRAREVVLRVANSFLKGAGVFGIEMFLGDGDQIWVNEIAPRVHNSGHLTIEACKVSQFKNHVLAVTEQPIEDTDMIYPYAGMVNIIGDYTGGAEVSKRERVFVHDYQKSPRPERKLGHVTYVCEDYEEFLVNMRRLNEALTR